MNAYTPPIRTPQIDRWADTDDCCDLCCATPVRTELDGDKLCQECADKWCRGEQPDEDDADELRHSLRHAGVYRGAMIEARIEDVDLLRLSKGQMAFGRAKL